MMKIYKYPLGIFDKQILSLSSDKILSVKKQKDKLVLYALYKEEDAFKGQAIDIVMIGTGHEISEEFLKEFTFLDTIMLDKEDLVLHIFYKFI